MEIAKQIEQEIIKAKTILITSHIRPDWDALCCTLMTYDLLKNNFPDKTLVANIENWSLTNAELLPNFEIVGKLETEIVIDSIKPDLIIVVDTPHLLRSTFKDVALKEKLSNAAIPTIITIDHHPLEDTFPSKIVYNTKSSAGVEEIYTCLIEKLKLKETENTRFYLGVGIYGDTNGFMFFFNSTQTFRLAALFTEAGHSYEKIDAAMGKIALEHVLLSANALKNMRFTDDILYTYIDDELTREKTGFLPAIYSEVKEIVAKDFMRRISDGITFILYPEPDGYKGSIRIQGPKYDARIFAKYLGGAGHRPACGFKLIGPKSMEEAVEIVLNVMRKHKNEAEIKN